MQWMPSSETNTCVSVDRRTLTVMRVGNAIGFSATVFALGALLVSAPGATLLACCFLTGFLVVGRWLVRGEVCKRLIHDADHQHTAWKAGVDDVAFFGRYQPYDLRSSSTSR
jgi:hypothetical protein